MDAVLHAEQHAAGALVNGVLGKGNFIDGKN